MQSCCQSNHSHDRNDKSRCPVCQIEAKSVPLTTVLHNVAQPWRRVSLDHVYYFCSNRQCDIIYFDNAEHTINKSLLRSAFAIDSETPCTLICYCFGISQQDYLNDPAVKEFVVEQTKLNNCACEVKNISGKCCLRDFPKG